MPRKRPCPTKGCKNARSSGDAKTCLACYKSRGSTNVRKMPECPNKGCTNLMGSVVAKQCKSCYDKRGGGTQSRQGEDPTRDREVERLKQDNKRLRKGYAATIKAEVEEERILGLFEGAIGRFPALPHAAFKTPRTGAKPVLSTEVPMLLLGDQQIGEVVSLSETRGINEYNFQIYQDRLELLENSTVDILTHHQRAPFEELVVLSLGDNVSGVIHEELQKHGHQHIIDQVYLGALTSALFLYRLLARLRSRGILRIRVVGVSGNHGRLSKLKESKQYYKNFDYMFHNIMALALADVPEIEFHIPKALFTVVDVCGYNVLVSHGHELPPSSLGIPLYSINRAAAGYQELLAMTEDQKFDYWIMGHFHRPLEMDHSIVNGTMVGMSEFGIGRFKPIPAAQKLLGFHEKWGKSWEYLLQLNHAPAASVYRFDMEMGTEDAISAFTDATRSV
jgi:hypothetical protein